ncbi:ribokinase [Oceanispirochaeta crateris]|uniref:Ribokinase n=1 Tax=Oceanispirochaeta crateris TaxID=2518645 RepID=A0A5C1QU29_9SPIO|nr:ribokinase [Oceanispirochaeta crateris]QEN09552.1 ribokinase [Oceanispirochaeta crateris]
MKILNYGSLNIDIVYKVPHIVKPGETISASDVQKYAGGKGANQSVALAKAGAPVWHGGTIGSDGLWLLDLLNKFNVKTELVSQYEGPTGQAIIQVSDKGQNSIFLFGGGNQNNTEAEVDKALAHFEEGDYLVLQNEINLTPYIIEKASARGMKICLNPAPFTENIKSWPLEKLDLLVVNEIEGQDLAGKEGSFEETLDQLTNMYPGMSILLTAGKAGAYFGKDSQREFVPIVDAPVVDTTAAGDTFFGYFLAGRLKGSSVREAMEDATRASAITVSRPGAMDSIPYAQELQ